MRELTDDELARAIRLDPSQIAGLGPSLDALIAMLLERKRKILEKYESETVQDLAARQFAARVSGLKPPAQFQERYRKAIRQEQIYDLERIWYAQDDERSPFARGLVQVIERLGEKYQVDELAAKYAFTGRTPMTVEQALEIKEELEKIDRAAQAVGASPRNGADRGDRYGRAGGVHRTGRSRAVWLNSSRWSKTTSAMRPSARD